MIYKKVEYKVHPQKLEEVKQAILAFLKEIKQAERFTRYEIFETGDEGEFVHFMQFQDEESEQHHRNADYTLKFIKIIYPACINAPEFIDLYRCK